MKYEVEFKPRAIKHLKKIDKNSQKSIINRINKMSHDLMGDVKKLTNYTPEYRLRVGDYRILFEIEGNIIMIYAVLNRKESYR